MSDSLGRPVGQGLVLDQHITKYFNNPLSEAAKDALRNLPKKIKKLKVKKQKKKAALPQSNLNPGSKGNTLPVASKKVKSKDPPRIGKKARLQNKTAETKTRPIQDIPESLTRAAAETLIQLSGQSAKHKQQKSDGNAEVKVEKKRRKKKTKISATARIQQHLPQVSETGLTPLAVLGRGNCRSDPISID